MKRMRNLQELVTAIQKCPYEGCGYQWVARVPNPKQCPRCHRYLILCSIYPDSKKEEEGNA